MSTIQTRIGALQARHFLIVCCWGALGLLLAACGSSDPAGAPQPEAAIPVSKPANTPAQTKNPLADMVKAVPVSPGEQPVELRFELPKPPVLAEPFDVNLNVLGLADASGLELKVTSHPNVEVITGAAASLGALKTGESTQRTVQLRMSDTGITVIDVQLTAIVAGNPVTAAFTIPVALPAASEAATATAGATTGK